MVKKDVKKETPKKEAPKKEEEVKPELSDAEILENFFDAVPDKENIVVSVIGDGGLGKTHFANTFPQPVISDTESRAHIVARKFEKNKNYIKKTATNKQIKQTIEMIATKVCPDPAERHNYTWVMDSGSDWLQMAETEYLAEAKKDKVYPLILWAQVYEKIDQIFNVVRKLGVNAVITQQLKEKYVGEKGTGEFIPAGYKKFPYRVDISLYLQKGIQYKGDTYYEDFVVAKVLKDCWHSPEKRKPYLLDVSYEGIFNELKPYKIEGTQSDAIYAVLKEMEEKTGISIEQAKSTGQ